MLLLKRLLNASEPQSRFALAAMAAVLLPPILLGPWLPLLDLVGFVGMNSYPPKLSSGPLHFYVFQFTYIVHYALSRLLVNLGVSAGGQVLILYLLQAGLLFWVIQAMLRQFIAHAWICSLALCLGALAFWDGHFLWGGPLAFSLAAVALAIATVLTFEEVEAPIATVRLAVPLLALFSMMCHPFAFPFAAFLTALRFVFVRRCRVHSGLLLSALIVFAWIIRVDSPETPDTPQLSSLFGFSFGQLSARLTGLFTEDARMTAYLFGSTPLGLRCYLVAMGAVHLAGFTAAPWVAVVAKANPKLRLLAALNLGIAAMYFLAADNGVVTSWPQRILTFYSPFTFAAGIILPWHLVQRWRRADALAAPRAILWLVPAILLAAVVWVQFPILRLGKSIGTTLAVLRDGLLNTGLANAFIVFSNVDDIQPLYARAVPFLLFSDPALVRRNLTFFTEWHLQPRHPTRLIEQWFDLGRAKFEGKFTLTNGALGLVLDAQPEGAIPVAVGNNNISYGSKQYQVMRQLFFGNQLQEMGAVRDAISHYEAALRMAPDNANAENNLGAAWRRLGKPRDAVIHFRNATRLNPGFAEAFSNLGIALLELGDLNESIQAFESALKLRPDVPDWHCDAGIAYLKANRPTEAATHFERALALKPDFQRARDELARLRKP